MIFENICKESFLMICFDIKIEIDVRKSHQDEASRFLTEKQKLPWIVVFQIQNNSNIIQISMYRENHSNFAKKTSASFKHQIP